MVCVCVFVRAAGSDSGDRMRLQVGSAVTSKPALFMFPSNYGALVCQLDSFICSFILVLGLGNYIKWLLLLFLQVRAHKYTSSAI